MSDNDRTWDQFLRTALVLQQTMNCSEDELFEAAWAFLSRAHVRYHMYRYNFATPCVGSGGLYPASASTGDCRSPHYW